MICLIKPKLLLYYFSVTYKGSYVIHWSMDLQLGYYCCYAFSRCIKTFHSYSDLFVLPAMKRFSGHLRIIIQGLASAIFVLQMEFAVQKYYSKPTVTSLEENTCPIWINLLLLLSASWSNLIMIVSRALVINGKAFSSLDN